MESSWISAEERLPGDSDPVLAFVTWQNAGSDYCFAMHDDGWMIDDEDLGGLIHLKEAESLGLDAATVTHWQPLKPPAGGDT